MKHIYEVTAAGFDSASDETDDRVYWVCADSAEEVQRAISDTSATFAGVLPDGLGGFEQNLALADFVLPEQMLAFSEKLLEWASFERNKNRAVG